MNPGFSQLYGTQRAGVGAPVPIVKIIPPGVSPGQVVQTVSTSDVDSSEAWIDSTLSQISGLKFAYSSLVLNTAPKAALSLFTDTGTYAPSDQGSWPGTGYWYGWKDPQAGHAAWSTIYADIMSVVSDKGVLQMYDGLGTFVVDPKTQNGLQTYPQALNTIRGQLDELKKLRVQVASDTTMIASLQSQVAALQQELSTANAATLAALKACGG